MDKHSSISSSKRFSVSFAIALALIIVLEVFLFSRARILLDRTSLSRYYKSEIIKHGPDWDVVIFGSSRSVVINAKKLQDATKNKLTVYNFSVAETGMNSAFYFELKNYLKHHGKPRLLMLTMVNENLGVKNMDDIGTYPATLDGVPLDNIISRDISGYCSLFNPMLFVGEVSLIRGVELFYVYMRRILPSFRYQKYLQRTFPMDIFYNIHLLDLRVLSKQSSLKETIDVNKQVLARIDSTHGQMIYSEDQVVSEEQLQKALPAKGKSLQGVDNQNIWLEKFIKLADGHDIKTVFFFMPLESSRYKRMRELGWFNYAEKQFGIYEKKYKNFTYYQDNNLSYERRFFGDWSHLNKDGAQKFNTEFADDFLKILDKTIGHAKK